MELELSLRMLSDWQIGTGTGAPGYLDRIVQREVRVGDHRPGPPIVPAKTLVGVWRDACELAAHALDSGAEGVWHEWVLFLFGDQYGREDATTLRPAALVVEGALRLPSRLAELLLHRPKVARAATFRKPGVRIDPVTGTAVQRMLRFEEMARGGVTLRGRARIEGFEKLSPKQRRAALTLLSAGAQLLETIGGKRRRGPGRCRLTVTGAGFPAEVTLPDDGDVPAPPQVRPYAVPEYVEAVPVQPASGWERVELIMTVEEPVLVAATVEGNLVTGAGHIPGWCLMPEVVRRLGGPAHALVRAGDLVVTAAMPLSEKGEPTHPVPRVLMHEKGNPEEIAGNVLYDDPSGLKAHRTSYITETGDVVLPKFTVRMHNTISDDKQRPLRKIGGVYIYRAIAAGVRLRAEVRVRRGAMPPGWEKRLSGAWRVGRSSKDDYGKVRVEARQAAAPPPRPGAGGFLRVWLLSDLLVRDKRLRPSTELADVRRALEQAFARAGATGVSLHWKVRDQQSPNREPATSENGVLPRVVGAARTESWHRGWGLPRPTLYGLAAGSVLTFEVEGGPISAEVLAEVRTAGVGERRAEGFGQVEFDHPLVEWRPHPEKRDKLADGPQRMPVPPLMTPDEEGYESARIYERAAWRDAIHRAAAVISGDRTLRCNVLPEDQRTSQLNQLREIAADLPSPGVAARLERLMPLSEGRDERSEADKKAVTALFTTPDRVWALLNRPSDELASLDGLLPLDELVVTADGARVLRDELWPEAVRVLLNACLREHAREDRVRSREEAR